MELLGVYLGDVDISIAVGSCTGHTTHHVHRTQLNHVLYKPSTNGWERKNKSRYNQHELPPIPKSNSKN